MTNTLPSPVFVIGGDSDLVKIFTQHGRFYMVSSPARAEVLVYPGGPDVCPDLYSDVTHPRTRDLRARDERYLEMYYSHPEAIHVGVCGGGQFLNVVNGGRMWQDVDKHAIRGTHPAIYVGTGGQEIVYQVTSTHHQMMRPAMHGEVWGFCRLSTHRDMGADRCRPTNFDDDGPDIEIVYYNKTKSLCFQPHPEYGIESTKELFFRCLGRIILPF